MSLLRGLKTLALEELWKQLSSTQNLLQWIQLTKTLTQKLELATKILRKKYSQAFKNVPSEILFIIFDFLPEESAKFAYRRVNKLFYNQLTSEAAETRWKLPTCYLRLRAQTPLSSLPYYAMRKLRPYQRSSLFTLSRGLCIVQDDNAYVWQQDLKQPTVTKGRNVMYGLSNFVISANSKYLLMGSRIFGGQREKYSLLDPQGMGSGREVLSNLNSVLDNSSCSNGERYLLVMNERYVMKYNSLKHYFTRYEWDPSNRASLIANKRMQTLALTGDFILDVSLNTKYFVVLLLRPTMGMVYQLGILRFNIETLSKPKWRLLDTIPVKELCKNFKGNGKLLEDDFLQTPDYIRFCTNILEHQMFPRFRYRFTLVVNESCLVVEVIHAEKMVAEYTATKLEHYEDDTKWLLKKCRIPKPSMWNYEKEPFPRFALWNECVVFLNEGENRLDYFELASARKLCNSCKRKS